MKSPDYSKALQPKKPTKKDDLDPKIKSFLNAVRKVHEEYRENKDTTK